MYVANLLKMNKFGQFHNLQNITYGISDSQRRATVSKTLAAEIYSAYLYFQKVPRLRDGHDNFSVSSLAPQHTC